jgi:ankyrin repeat protein
MIIRCITNRDFFRAVKTGDEALVREYIKATGGLGDSLSERNDDDNTTPLSTAVLNGHTSIALLLIKSGANLSATSGNNVTTLFVAAVRGNLIVVNALIAAGAAKINDLHFSGLTAVEAAAIRGHTEIVTALLNAGAVIQYDDLLDKLMQQEQVAIAEIKKLEELKLPTCEIKQEDIQTIVKLSRHNIARLKTIMSRLNKSGLLNPDTVSIALQRITKKNPAAHDVKITKKVKQVPRNEYNLNNGLTFFLDSGSSKQKDLAGGQATINKGYRTADIPEHGLCVKRFYGCEGNQVRIASAKRETAVIKLLGRNADWYMNKKGPVVVTPWNNGIDVAKIIKHDLLKQSTFANRLQWLVSGLNDLNILHLNYRLHGDIKCENFVVNLNENVMKLIDFGATQKVDSKKEYVFTLAYLDPNCFKPKTLAADMYAMSIFIAAIFPELFNIETKPTTQVITNAGEATKAAVVPKPHITKKKVADITPIEHAIMNLYDALQEVNPENRCTSEQALQYCQNILAKLTPEGDIHPDELQNITDATINRSSFTVEDAMRGSERPARFQAATAPTPAIAKVRTIDNKAIESPVTIFNQSPKKRLKSEIDQQEHEAPKLN